MPEIELKPKTIEATARRRRPLSKPLAWGMVVFGCGVLVSIYWLRNEVTADNLFFGAAFLAFCIGLIIAEIFRDVD